MRAAWPSLLLLLLAARRSSVVAATATGGGTGRPVDRVVGRWSAPPVKVPSDSVVDGPLLGNGNFAAVLSSDVGAPATSGSAPPSRGEMRFHCGMNDFFAAPTNGFSSCGYPDLDGSNKPGMKQVGGVTLVAPALGAGSLVAPLSFSADQRPANGTVTVTLRGGKVELRVRSWVHATEPLLMLDLVLISDDPRMRSLELSIEAWSVLGCGLGPNPLVEDSFLPVKTGLSGGGPRNRTLWVTRQNGFEYQQQDGVYNLTTAAVAVRLLGPSGFAAAAAGQRCTRASASQHYGADYLPCAVGNFTLHAGAQNGATIAAAVLSDRQLGWQGDLVESATARLQNLGADGQRKLSATVAPTATAVAQLERTHAAWWEKYWNASWVSWPSSPVVEKMWCAGEPLPVFVFECICFV